MAFSGAKETKNFSILQNLKPNCKLMIEKVSLHG